MPNLADLSYIIEIGKNYKMVDIVTALENITPAGIVGIMLIFIAIFMLVSAGSWAITKYTRSKNDTVNQKNEISPSKIIKEELQTE